MHREQRSAAIAKHLSRPVIRMAIRQAETVVLGGGISGLAAAFYLRSTHIRENNIENDHKQGQGKVVVLEGSSRVGGWLDSFKTPEGATHERGTRSIRPVGVVGKNTLDLVSAIGLDDAIVPVTRSHPATQNRFIYTQDGLHRLPSSLSTILRRQDPFSQSLLTRLLKEPFAVKCKEDDETIHDFFSRRLGKEIAEYLANPFCRGIFAGDSKQLSMRACFPAIFDAERKYNSIIIGGFRSKPEKFPDIGTSSIAQRAKEQKWASWTMTNGLQTLPNRLSDWLVESGVEVQRSNPCSRIEFVQEAATHESQKRVRIVTENEDVWEADHVVCSTPAQVTERLLPPEHHTLSRLLGQITSCTVAVVNLEYENLHLPVTGFGYLVPSTVQSNILGVVFDSCAFPELDRRKNPTTRMTCMMGGAWFNDLFGDPHSVDPNDLLSCALTSIKGQLGISQKPTFTKVNIHHDCIPQYKLGHTKLVDDIQVYIKDHHLPLTVLGSSYRGVSVNDCIFQARQAVSHLQT